MSKTLALSIPNMLDSTVSDKMAELKVLGVFDTKLKDCRLEVIQG